MGRREGETRGASWGVCNTPRNAEKMEARKALVGRWATEKKGDGRRGGCSAKPDEG